MKDYEKVVVFDDDEDLNDKLSAELTICAQDGLIVVDFVKKGGKVFVYLGYAI